MRTLQEKMHVTSNLVNYSLLIRNKLYKLNVLSFLYIHTYIVYVHMHIYCVHLYLCMNVRI